MISFPTGEYLKMARHSVGVLKRIKRVTISSQKTESWCGHAIKAIIFSSCAVESHVNIFLSLPLLKMERIKERKFYASITSETLKGSIRKKIGLLRKEFSLSKKMASDLNRVFDMRNSLVHASPTFNEQKYVPDEMMEQLGERDEDKLPTKPILSLTPQSFELRDDALFCCKVAHDLIDFLDFKNAFKV